MIEYRGERFSGYNKPKRSRKGGKKFAVLAKQGNTVKMIRFGDANMKIKRTSLTGVKASELGTVAILAHLQN